MVVADLAQDPYPPALRSLAAAAIARARRRLKKGAPTLAVHTVAWMRALSRGAPPEAYFTHARAFPMLLLPWWLEAMIRGSPAPAFQRDILYSTITGYYFVRMIDDLMDGEHPPRSESLPALIFFHTEFQQTYHRYFPYGHPFWGAFEDASYAAAETASRDAAPGKIDRAQFLATSARKIAGAKVPLAAVCHRYERPDLLEPWSAFVDLLGRWHQMLNDMHGWSQDLGRGTSTYFLSEASSRAEAEGSVAEWVVTDGFAWGMEELDIWMEDLLVAARQLDAPPLVTYLEARRAALRFEWQELRRSLVPLEVLASALRPHTSR
jgi:hypothetical protein